MKLIYFSQNMAAYDSALYQQDVMDEVAKQAEVFFYGPGFPGYRAEDTLDDVVAKSGVQPDLFIMGHSWLKDKPGQPVDAYPRIRFKEASVPVLALMNKEYVNLPEKLDYFKEHKFAKVFSHHHEVEKYSRETGIDFVFWPFGVNHRLFNVAGHGRPKVYDLAFSGILQNQNKNARQTDIRLRIQNFLFYSCAGIRLKKRGNYGDSNIFWNAFPMGRFRSKVSTFLGVYRRLPLEDYRNLLADTKIYLNTLSPVSLVSTRYYESMASRSLVLAEESAVYKMIFKGDNIVSFKSDLSDFEEKFKYYLNNRQAREEITDRAYQEVMKDHTWEKRVRDLLTSLN